MEATHLSPSFVSAFAALAGALIGGLTSFLASWLTQRAQSRASWFVHDASRRQDLYREFIEEAVRCYSDALQHGTADLPSLVSLYAKIDRMRVVSSTDVVVKAEEIVKKILNTFLEPDKSFLELRESVMSNSIDLLGGFSQACRTELASLRAQHI
jgi:hypothetical protein